VIRRKVASPLLAGALAAAICAAAGCAPGGYYNTSQSALDSLLTTQSAMMKQISALQRQVDANRESQNVTRANTDAKLLDISQRLDVLGGQLEDSGVRVTQLSQKVDTVKYKLTAADSARAASGAAPRDSTTSMDPEAMYQAAYSDIAAGRYSLARESFQTYLKNFPDTEVADNAQYWIGECNYVTGDFAGAIAEFDKVVKNYPKGDKVPAALLKMGISYGRLKNTDEATKYYKMLIQKYPKSPEAAAAKERLGTKS